MPHRKKPPLSFAYNAAGIRTQKTIGSDTTEYFLDGSTVLAEKTGNNIIWYIYGSNGDLVGFTYNDTPYFYLKNQQGDVCKIVDANGTVVGSYTYDPWGKVIYDDNGPMVDINPIRYRSYYYDKETGLYYLQSRYYDPELGRFINADSYPSTGQGLNGNNMFAYCGNNPVMRVDEAGSYWDTIIDVVSLCFSVVDVIKNPDDPWAWVGLAADIVSIVVPCVAGGGAIVKAATKADDIYDGLKFVDEGIDIVDDFHDAGKTTYYMTADVCFVAGTLIHTEDGHMPIEEIKTGQLVWAWDETTNTVALKPVVETYVNETSELVHIFVQGEEIISTPSHPFYSPVKGWTDAVHLRAGDILVTVNGELVVVEKIQHEILESPITVYNFQVEGYHTYYVSNINILVHNDCYKPIRDGDMRATINPGELEAPHAHIFQKNNNIGRIFSNGKLDESLINNRNAMKFVKKHYDEIIELIDKFYGKR